MATAHAPVPVSEYRGRQSYRYKTNFSARKLGHRRLRVRVYQRDDYSCCCCGVPAREVPCDYDGRYALMSLSGHYLVLDHVVPAVRGGRLEFDNLQTLCELCNGQKGAR